MKGVFPKYQVRKLNEKGVAYGDDVPGCFILRPDRDPAALEAIKAYANATNNPTLAADLNAWANECKAS